MKNCCKAWADIPEIKAKRLAKLQSNTMEFLSKPQYDLIDIAALKYDVIIPDVTGKIWLVNLAALYTEMIRIKKEASRAIGILPTGLDIKVNTRVVNGITTAAVGGGEMIFYIPFILSLKSSDVVFVFAHELYHTYQDIPIRSGNYFVEKKLSSKSTDPMGDFQKWYVQNHVKINIAADFEDNFILARTGIVDTKFLIGDDPANPRFCYKEEYGRLSFEQILEKIEQENKYKETEYQPPKKIIYDGPVVIVDGPDVEGPEPPKPPLPQEDETHIEGPQVLQAGKGKKSDDDPDVEFRDTVTDMRTKKDDDDDETGGNGKSGQGNQESDPGKEGGDPGKEGGDPGKEGGDQESDPGKEGGDPGKEGGQGKEGGDPGKEGGQGKEGVDLGKEGGDPGGDPGNDDGGDDQGNEGGNEGGGQGGDPGGEGGNDGGEQKDSDGKSSASSGGGNTSTSNSGSADNAAQADQNIEGMDPKTFIDSIIKKTDVSSWKGGKLTGEIVTSISNRDMAAILRQLHKGLSSGVKNKIIDAISAGVDHIASSTITSARWGNKNHMWRKDVRVYNKQKTAECQINLIYIFDNSGSQGKDLVCGGVECLLAVWKDYEQVISRVIAIPMKDHFDNHTPNYYVIDKIQDADSALVSIAKHAGDNNSECFDTTLSLLQDQQLKLVDPTKYNVFLNFGDRIWSGGVRSTRAMCEYVSQYCRQNGFDINHVFTSVDTTQGKQTDSTAQGVSAEFNNYKVNTIHR